MVIRKEVKPTVKTERREDGVEIGNCDEEAEYAKQIPMSAEDADAWKTLTAGKRSYDLFPVGDIAGLIWRATLRESYGDIKSLMWTLADSAIITMLNLFVEELRFTKGERDNVSVKPENYFTLGLADARGAGGRMKKEDEAFKNTAKHLQLLLNAATNIFAERHDDFDTDDWGYTTYAVNRSFTCEVRSFT